jgi:hypothetical protein
MVDVDTHGQGGDIPTARGFVLTDAAEVQIREAATNVLNRSLALLVEYQVLPTSRYRPWIEVGRDYEGHLVHGSEEQSLTKILQAALPGRFTNTVSSVDSPWSYPFALVEAAVAAATLADEPYEVTSPSVQGVLNELVDKLRAVPRSTVLRLVSDVDVEHSAMPGQQQDPLGETIEIGGVRVIRVENWAERFIEQQLPSAGYEVERSDVVVSPGPESLIVATKEGMVDEATRVTEARRQVANLIAAIRLATGSTVHVMVDVAGDPNNVRCLHPVITPLRSGGLRLVHRPTALSGRDTLGLSHLALLVDTWAADGDWIPVSIALGRLERSLDTSTPGIVDQVVDLAVGLEAALGGNEKTEISLRLRTRAANVLATDDDPSDAIYRDVKTLYRLRSTFVHGGTLSATDAQKAIRSVSGVSVSKWPGVQYLLAIDRWRDLLRRAILARIALVTAVVPWPGRTRRGKLDVDELLLRENQRDCWRQHVRTFWTELGLPYAPERAPPAHLAIREGSR